MLRTTTTAAAAVAIRAPAARRASRHVALLAERTEGPRVRLAALAGRVAALEAAADASIARRWPRCASTAAAAVAPSDHQGIQHDGAAERANADAVEPSQAGGLPRDFGNLVLRDYQVECVEECLRTLASGQASRIGVSSPTGSGKTTIFSALLAALPNRKASDDDDDDEARQVLVIVSSIALATQTARAIASAHPSLHVELEQGTAFHSTGLADVTVATAQTLSRSRARLDKFEPRRFKAVVVDEAHHAAAPSYVSILAHFDPEVEVPLQRRGKDGSPRSSGIPIIGFSATFARHDGVALGKVFQRIVYHKDFLEMVNANWLSPVRFTSVRTSVDLASVPTSSATHDFRTSALAEVMNTRALNQVIVRTWLDRAGGTSTASTSSISPATSPAEETKSDDEHTTTTATKSTSPNKARRTTLVFAVNVAHVIDLTQAFRDAGVDARYVHGAQRPAFREQVIKDFGNGVFPVLVNCAVLTEGADIPSIDCLILARPTRSRNVFMQMLGRGLRLSPKTNKDDCLVLDVVGATERGVMCTPTLFGLDVADVIDDATIEELRERARERAEKAAAAALAEAADHGGERATYGSDAPPMPRRITYVDYDSPEALQAAMLGPVLPLPFEHQGDSSGAADAIKAGAEPYVPVEKISWNAWVDCGGGVFVLEIPPGDGYVKIRKTGGGDDTVEADEDEDQDVDEEEGEDDASDSGETANWVAHYYPRNPSAAEFDNSSTKAAFFLRRTNRGPAYILRPRLILEASTLDAAVRGADTYVERSVLRGAMSRIALCRRKAEWRNKLATAPQKALVRKRLGYGRMAVSSSTSPSSSSSSSATAGTPSTGASRAGSRRTSTTEGSKAAVPSSSSSFPPQAQPPTPADPLATLTKGQAALILTRLNHGAKKRWSSAAKKHNRLLRTAERDARRAEEEAGKEERRLRRVAERERESERRRAGVVQVGDLT